jgi:predicted permease
MATGTQGMPLETLFSLIGALAAMAAIGAGLSRFIHFGDEVKQAFIMIIVNLAMPCMIFSSLTQLSFDFVLLQQMLLVFLLSILFHSLGMALGWAGSLPLRVSLQKQKELAVLSGLGNSGFIGIPLCAVLFGPQGALLAAIFDSGLDVVLWSYVIFVLKVREAPNRKNRVWRRLKSLVNAPLLAIGAGLIFAVLQIEPPAMLKQVFGMLGNVTVPLAMLYIGLMLAQLLRLRPKVRWTLLPTPIVVKLFVLPLIAAYIMKLLSLGTSVTDVVLIQTAMPTMTLASVIFAKCSADEELAAVTTIASTVLSIASIPIILTIFDH